jgi:hypothetical protein
LIKKGDTIPGIFTLFIGILTLIYIFSKPQMAIIGDVSRGGVGPGFFPFVCCVILIIFGLILIVFGIKQNGMVDYFQMTPERKENLKVTVMLVIFILLLLVCWKVSELFFVFLPIYCFAVNKNLKQSTTYSIAFTVAMTAFVYLLFKVAFGIRFKP